MEATRQILWNIDFRGLMYFAALAAFLIFFLGIRKKIRGWAQGRKGNAPKDWAAGIKSSFWHILKHHKTIFKSHFRRTMHLVIFYGFMVLLIGTIIVALQYYFHLLVFSGPPYLLISLLLDLFGLLAIIGVVMAAYKRYINHRDRKNNTLDHAVTLILLFVILVTGFILEGLRIFATGDIWAQWTPVGLAVAKIIQVSGLSISTARVVHFVLWYGHMLLSLGFIAYIPYSNLLHMIASPFNILLKSSSRLGALTPIGVISEQTSSLGCARLEDFSKKQLLELDACLSCLRCEKHCPAYESGVPFSPRLLVQRLKKHAAHRYSFLGSSVKNFDSSLIETVIAKESLLSCTTCGLCEVKCPVSIEHVRRIIDLRRSFMNEVDGCKSGGDDYPAEFREVFENLAKTGNPWGLPPNSIEDSDIPLLSEKKNTDILFWVGCFGAYESRNSQVTRAMLNILKKSGVDFSVLGGEEKCCGDTARRLGNEPLFQQLAVANIKTLSGYKFNTLVTACPHCYNTFKNEYPELGGVYRVKHHSELILELIESGQIKLQGTENTRITCQDPCYLGRYNNIYDAPRKILSSIPGLELVEMRNSKAMSACCGAGGGQIWRQDEQMKKVSALRVEEAMRTEAKVIASACPLCLATLTDAVDNVGAGPKVVDIAEIVNQVTR